MRNDRKSTHNQIAGLGFLEGAKDGFETLDLHRFNLLRYAARGKLDIAEPGARLAYPGEV